jgi:hypothetical protein
LARLAKNVSESIRSGHIASDYFQTTIHNKRNKVHSLICGIIEQTGRELGYVVEREKHFYFEDGIDYFRPDLLIWKNDCLSLLVEYESTNSSDSRVIQNDLWHYIRALNLDSSAADTYLPKYWLIIYTLPGGPVEHWISWDYRKADPDYVFMRRNPHRFYKSAFENPSRLCLSRRDPGIVNADRLQAITKYCDLDSRSDRKLFLLNMTIHGLEIDFPEAFHRKLRF